MTGNPGDLRDFESFCKEMSELPSLQPLKDDRRHELFDALYQIARKKVAMERQARAIQMSVPTLRAERIRFREASRLIGRALQYVKKARTSYAAELEQLDAMRSQTSSSWKLDFVEKVLNSDVVLLECCEVVQAESIHPKKRTRAEKRLCIDERPIPHPDIPLTEKLKPIDHWFIRSAAACLKDHDIKRRDSVIAKLFSAAGVNPPTEESIRQHLRDRKRRSKPAIDPSKANSASASS
jgi:hypothetical protein